MIIEPNSIEKLNDNSTEPITLSEAKDFLRVTHSDDDTYITSLITMVRQSAEISTNRTLNTQANTRYLVGYTAYPLTYCRLRIPYPKTVTIEEMYFYDADDVKKVVFDLSPENSMTNDIIVEDDTNANVYLTTKANYGYESLSRYRRSKVYIKALAGGYVPEVAKQGMLLLLAHYYDNREPVSFNANPTSVPRTVSFLFNQCKVRTA